MKRVLLIVDDEDNVRKSLIRALRREQYEIHSACGGAEALELLETLPVGVIISDQRMPGMSGSEFLSIAKERFPDTVRIILSGYTELRSITDAINDGAIYKFLTKPWDDKLLAANIQDAFEHYELKAENIRLSGELKKANDELFKINQDLEQRIEERTREAMINLYSLQVSQEVLQHLPMGVLGISDDGLIAVANEAAIEIVGKKNDALAGSMMTQALPEPIIREIQVFESEGRFKKRVSCDETGAIEISICKMGERSPSRGTIIILTRA